MVSSKINYDRATREFFEHQGFMIAKTEVYSGWSKRKNDLFGVIDFLAVGQCQIIAIQSTVKSEVNKRHKKIISSKIIVPWLHGGGEFILFAWHNVEHKYVPMVRKYHCFPAFFTPTWKDHDWSSFAQTLA